MLKTILSISGKPGLYKLISQGKNMLIVESVNAEKKRFPAYGNEKIISLADIAMYTDDAEVPLYDVLEAMKMDLGQEVKRLKADGGASANNYLLQTQADLTGVQVDRPACVETTAMGAAYLAGLAVGFWKNKEEIARGWKADRSFFPKIEEEVRCRMLKGWQKAVRCSYGWAKDGI